MFPSLRSNEVVIRKFINESQIDVKVKGLYCDNNDQFIGPVSISKYQITKTGSILIEETVGTLDPKRHFHDLVIVGICSRSLFEKDVGLIISSEIGVIGKNNHFDISICRLYEKGRLSEILINLPKPTDSLAFKDAIASIELFREHYKDDIAVILLSPVLRENQRYILQSMLNRNSTPPYFSCSLSIDNMLQAMIEVGLVVTYEDNNPISRLDDSEATIAGTSKQIFRLLPIRNNEKLRMLRSKESISEDKSIKIELEELKVSELAGMTEIHKLRRCTTQTNTKTHEVITVIFQKLHYVASNIAICQKMFSYHDGTIANSTGYISFETNHVDDALLRSAKIPEKDKFREITKIRITYLNNPVGARIISIFKGEECFQEIKMLSDFKSKALADFLLTDQPMLLGYNIYLDRQHTVEYSNFFKPLFAKQFHVKKFSLFKKNNVFFEKTAVGTMDAENGLQISEETYMHLSKKESVRWINDHVSSDSLVPFQDMEGSSTFSESFDSSRSSSVSEDEMNEESASSETSFMDIKEFLDEDYFSIDTASTKGGAETLSINEDWENLFWEIEEDWDLEVNKISLRVTDPLVLKLSSRWTQASETKKNIREIDKDIERFFNDREQEPVSKMVPDVILDAYQKNYLQKVFFSALCETPKKYEDASDFCMYTVLKYRNYPEFLDLSWAKGKEKDAYKQPLHLIEMLRDQIYCENPAEGAGIHLSFGTLLLIMRLVSWVDVRLIKTGTLPSSDLEVMHFLKSNAFMKYLMQLAKSDRFIKLDLAGYSIKDKSPRTIEEQIAKVVCHLISIPNKPVHYLHYLLLLNGCGLAQIRGGINAQVHSEQHATFTSLMERHPLYNDYTRFISQLNLSDITPEKTLILAYVLGHIAHDSIPKNIPNKYRFDNEYRSLIKLRHSVCHGKSFSCAHLATAEGVIFLTKKLITRAVDKQSSQGLDEECGTGMSMRR